MSKKIKLTMLLTAVVAVAIVGFSYAATYQSASDYKPVSTNTLGISLVQTADEKYERSETADVTDSAKANVAYKKVIPGNEVNEKVAVKTDTTSQATYIRVTATRYWLDESGKKIEKVEGEDGYVDPTAIKINTTDKTNWKIVEDPDDPEVIYYYYLLPVEGNAKTTNLMDSFIVDASYADNDYADKSTHIDFYAEGVQKLAGKDAILAEWGANVELDDNGKITSLEMQ